MITKTWEETEEVLRIAMLRWAGSRGIAIPDAPAPVPGVADALTTLSTPEIVLEAPDEAN